MKRVTDKYLATVSLTFSIISGQYCSNRTSNCSSFSASEVIIFDMCEVPSSEILVASEIPSAISAKPFAAVLKTVPTSENCT